MDRKTFLKSCAVGAGMAAMPQLKANTESNAYSPYQSDKPNILFIFTDQQFADTLSCLKDPYLHTPNIDELYKDGVLFDTAYSPNPICVPCRASVITGQHSHTTGVTYNMEPGHKAADTLHQYQALGTTVKEAGYDTGYFGKWHIPVDLKKHPKWHGFDEFVETREYKEIFEDYDGFKDNKTSELCSKFIRKNRNKPFFLVASYNNPHDVCEWARVLGNIRDHKMPSNEIPEHTPDEEFLPKLPENAMAPFREPSVIREHQNQEHLRGTYPGREWLNRDDLWRKYRWGYYRMVELIDQHVGHLIKTLKETDQYDNTVIIFTSDHGDGLGAHQWNQKTMFYEESARVPFIITDPRSKDKQKINSDTHVNIGTDIYPTICDYAGAGIPASLPGMSLKPTVQKNEEHLDRLIVSQNDLFYAYEESLGIEGRMLRKGKFKYVVYNQGEYPEQLFDLENDPGEMRNLAYKKSQQSLLTQYRNLLKKWCEENRDAFKFPV